MAAEIGGEEVPTRRIPQQQHLKGRQDGWQKSSEGLRCRAGSRNRCRCHDIVICTQVTSHVGTDRANMVLNTSPQENSHFTMYQGAPGRGEG